MLILFHIEAFLCLIFTIYLYFKYAMKGIRLYAIILNISVWFLTFVTAFIIPFDIQINSRIITPENNEDIENEKKYFKFLYFVIYWFIYVISWVIIPVAQEYEKAGDFTSKERFKRAIKTNIYGYLIILVISIGFIIYLIVKEQLDGASLLSFLILLSNAWGIFLVIFLLGYGLVAVPKHMLNLSDYKNRLHYLEFCAAEAKINLEERNIDLIACAQKIKSVKSILEADPGNPNRGFIEKIWLDLTSLNFTSNQDSIVEEELQLLSKKFKYEELVNLNQTIKRNKYDIIRIKCELDDIYKEWYHLQTLNGLIENSYNYNKNCWTRMSKTYHLHIRPWLFTLGAFTLTIMSFCTLLSEITLFVHYPLSLFGLLIEKSDNIYVLNIFCLIPLIFMFLTALYGIFNLKLSGFFSIHDNRQTDSASLLFLSGFMCRIGFPLCLNFVQILKLKLSEKESKKETLIEDIMGGTFDLGKNFMIFFPTILILLCLFNLFNIYGRIMNLLGFNTFGFKNSETDDKIEEGNEVLEKMRISIERDTKLNERHSTNSINKVIRFNNQKKNDLSLKLMEDDVKLFVKNSSLFS